MLEALTRLSPLASGFGNFAASWRKLTKQRNQALSIDVEAATP